MYETEEPKWNLPDAGLTEVFTGLACSLCDQGNYSAAEVVCHRALDLAAETPQLMRRFGGGAPVASVLHQYARVLAGRGDLLATEAMLRRELAILDRCWSFTDYESFHGFADCVTALVELLHRQRRGAEAGPYYDRAAEGLESGSANRSHLAYRMNREPLAKLRLLLDTAPDGVGEAI
jgi:hypothetical protein